MDSQEMPSLLPPASSTSSETESSTLPSENEQRSNLQSREDYISKKQKNKKYIYVNFVKIVAVGKEDFFNKGYKKDFMNFMKLLEPVDKARKKTIEEFRTPFLKGNSRTPEVENNHSHSNVSPCLKSLKEMILDDIKSGKLFPSFESTEDLFDPLSFYLTKFKTEILECTAENLLDDIFTVGENCRYFSDDEKRCIAKAMIHAIESIKENIYFDSFEMKSTVTCSILRKRSALQYLVEEYGQFPVDNTTLASKLEEANIKESIDMLDEIIDSWYCKPSIIIDDGYGYSSEYGCGSSCSSDYESDIDSDVECGGAEAVPSSHHAWWYK